MSRSRFTNRPPAGAITRRSDTAPTPFRASGLLHLLAILAIVLAACGGEDPTAADGGSDASADTSEAPRVGGDRRR